jgi:hypothetical protein
MSSDLFITSVRGVVMDDHPHLARLALQIRSEAIEQEAMSFTDWEGSDAYDKAVLEAAALLGIADPGPMMIAYCDESMRTGNNPGDDTLVFGIGMVPGDMPAWLNTIQEWRQANPAADDFMHNSSAYIWASF